MKTFAEVLEAGKPIEQEIIQQSKRTSNQSQVKDNRRPRSDGDFNQTAPIRRDNGLPPHLREKAMRDNLCFLCLDPNHRRQDCPYNVDTKRGMQPREQQISIERQIQMDRIFAKGRMLMPINKELYLKTMLAGISQIK